MTEVQLVIDQINAMAGRPWWEHTESFTTVAQAFDRMFLVCAAIVPMLKAAYFAYVKADKLALLHLAASETAG